MSGGLGCLLVISSRKLNPFHTMKRPKEAVRVVEPAVVSGRVCSFHPREAANPTKRGTIRDLSPARIL
jgi:hypothetical protein